MKFPAAILKTTSGNFHYEILLTVNNGFIGREKTKYRALFDVQQFFHTSGSIPHFIKNSIFLCFFNVLYGQLLLKKEDKVNTRALSI